MVAVLKQADVGVPVVEVCRRMGITEQTFYRWKKKYVGLEIDQVRQLKLLQEENGKLKKLDAVFILSTLFCCHLFHARWVDKDQRIVEPVAVPIPCVRVPDPS